MTTEMEFDKFCSSVKIPNPAKKEFKKKCLDETDSYIDNTHFNPMFADEQERPQVSGQDIIDRINEKAVADTKNKNRKSIH